MKAINKHWIEGEYGYIDKNGLSWDSPDEWVVMDLCGLCGCGDDSIKEDIIKVLIAIADRHDRDWPDDWEQPIKDEKYYELILHILTNADLLEHGGSVYGSWPTDKGEEVLRIILGEPIKK